MRNKIILVLSGPICGGKSSLASTLHNNYNFKKLETREKIKELYKKKIVQSTDRLDLQKFGEELDVKTKGQWIVQNFQEEIIKNDFVVIDAIRIKSQIDELRAAFGSQSVFHIHLTANEDLLKKRYIKRKEKDISPEELANHYEKVKADKTESRIEELANIADLLVYTDRNTHNDVAIRAVTYLKILPPTGEKLVDVLVGGQFGSEGKGQIAAYLSREYDCLVRTGGPNAGHSVYGQPVEVFHLLPSGTTKSPKSRIILGPGTIINLEKLLSEIKKYLIDVDRLLIDENVTIISQKDIEKETKFDKIGSTKQGVGFATANNITNRLKGISRFKASNVKDLKGFIGSAHSEYEKIFRNKQKILLEGTQGTFLSLHHGIYPYVTSRDTSVSGCLSEAGLSPRRVNRIIMVTRTYPIRVQSPDGGTSGPFGESTEIDLQTISNRSNIPLEELKKIEITTTTKRLRRISEFNWELFRKACEINSPTDIALTFTDYLSKDNRFAYNYEHLTSETIRFIEDLERCSGTDVSLISTDFSHRSIIDRRKWI